MQEEQSLTLTEHLEELRTRIIRAVIYLFVGMSLCWTFYRTLYEWLERPILEVLARYGSQLKPIDIMEPFWVRAQVSLVAGLVLALPLVLLELWGFIRPGLTPKERRVIRFLPIVVIILFLLGGAMGYIMSGVFVRWFLSEYFIMPGMQPELRVQGTILFIAKVMLAFGIGFQLPVVMVALNRVGILPGALLTSRWREATVGVFTTAAIITPSWDPISMILASLPLALLYLGTLGVIKLLERKDKKAEAQN